MVNFLSAYKVLLIFIKNIFNCSQMTDISYRKYYGTQTRRRKKSSHSETDTVDTLMYIFLHFSPCIFTILPLGMMMRAGEGECLCVYFFLYLYNNYFFLTTSLGKIWGIGLAQSWETDSHWCIYSNSYLHSHGCFSFSSQWSFRNKNLSSPPRQDWLEHQGEPAGAGSREWGKRQVVDGKQKEGWYSPGWMDRLSDETFWCPA